MKKAKLSVLLGSIFIILVFALRPAISTPLSSTSYLIPSLTISSGGHTGLQSSSYKLQDIKGQAVIGYGSSASYGLGLGGVYGTLGVEGVITAWGTDPHVQNLRIRREGTNIVVSWDTDLTVVEGMSPNFYVWTKEGPFENNSTNWTYTAMARGRTYFTHVDQVGTGLSQVYYRVLSTNDRASLVNKVAVGKVNLDVFVGWNEISVPFAPSALDNAIGVNFVEGDQFWAWRRGGWYTPPPITFSRGSWGTSVGLESGEGYGLMIISISEGATKTFIGNVKSDSFERTIVNDWNLIGNPYAKNLRLNYGFVTGKSIAGDQLWEWNPRIQGHKSTKTFDGTNWQRLISSPPDPDIDPDPDLLISKGYGYMHLGTGFNWQLLPSY